MRFGGVDGTDDLHFFKGVKGEETGSPIQRAMG